MVKKILLVLLAGLIIIQFIRPARNVNTTTGTYDINAMYHVPDSVNAILDKACYDCHSNNTRYPWYFNIQPVAWWMNDHIEEGKEELNFSEFGKRKPESQVKKLKKTAKEVEEGEMPLPSYTWIHKEAALSEHEKNIVINWARDLSQQIAAKQAK